MEYIAGEEKLELTSDGAELIARLADGALRDALSILDTCAGVTAKIDADVVRRMAGVTAATCSKFRTLWKHRTPPPRWHSWRSCGSSRWT